MRTPESNASNHETPWYSSVWNSVSAYLSPLTSLFISTQAGTESNAASTLNSSRTHSTPETATSQKTHSTAQQRLQIQLEDEEGNRTPFTVDSNKEKDSPSPIWGRHLPPYKGSEIKGLGTQPPLPPLTPNSFPYASKSPVFGQRGKDSAEKEKFAQMEAAVDAAEFDQEYTNINGIGNVSPLPSLPPSPQLGRKGSPPKPKSSSGISKS